MRSNSDLGGLPVDHIETSDSPPLPWQKLQMALIACLGERDLIIIDEVRRSLEELPAETYALGFYERWAEGLCNLLDEKQLVDRSAIDALITDTKITPQGMPLPLNSLSDDTHGHSHPVLAFDDDSEHDVNEDGRFEKMTEVMRNLLVANEIVAAKDIARKLEHFDAGQSELGPRIVARAWTDQNYRRRLLENGNAAVAELGLPAAGMDLSDTKLVVVENTPTIHNLVVCTLCSCYPRTILGVPPDWYKSKSYRARAVVEPRKVLAAFGTELSRDVTVRVHDSNADLRYLVLPLQPLGTESWNEDQLVPIVTRDSLIGVTTPLLP